MILLLAGCATPPEEESKDTGAPDWFDTAEEDDTGRIEDSDRDTSAEDCSISVKSTFPEDGATDAYYRQAIEFVLTAEDPTAWIEMDLAGTPGARDKTILYQPTAPLETDTTYVATLHWCGGEHTISFSTSSLGSTLVDTSGPEGRTYAWSFEDARLAEPTGIGSLLAESFRDATQLLGVLDIDAGEMSIRFGRTPENEPDRQDACGLTTDVEATLDGPYFSTSGPFDLQGVTAGYPIIIESARMEATFAPDASYFGGGVLTGDIDTRAFDSIVEEDAEEGAVCELAPAFGVECTACPETGEPYCLAVVVDSILGEEVDVEVVEVTTTCED